MTSRERRPSEGSWSVDGREERELPVDSNAEILVVGTVTVEARGAEEGNTMGGDSRPAGEETYAREELQEQSESTPQSRTQTTPLYDLSSGPSSRPTSQLQPSSAGTGFLLSAGEMPVTPNEGHVRAASAGSSVVATSHHGSIIQEGLSPPPSVTTPATAAPASFAAPSMSLMGEESSRPSFYDEEAIPSEEVTALQSIQNLIEGINAPMSRVTTPVHEGDAGPHVRGGSAASTSTQPAASSKPLGHSLPKNPNPSPPLPPAPTQSSGMKGALPFMERVEQGASSPGPVRRGSGSGAGSSNRKQQQQRAVVKGLPHQVAPELIVAITASSGVPSHATAAMDRMQHLVERGLQREPEGSHPTLGLQMQQQMLQGRTAVQTAVQGRSQSAGKEMNLNSMIIVRGLRDRGHSDMLTQPLHMGKQRTGVNSKINFGSLFGPPANTGGGTLPPHMVKEGLKRRKEAAIMMAQGPQPFIRKYVPRPDTPEGLKLDGFILLEAGDEELPEMIVAARLPSRNLSSVESADLEYFPALKVLDLGDNRIPDLATLSGLVGLRQLVLASNRLSRLGNMDLSFAFQQLQSLDLSYNKLGPKLVLGEGSPLASLPRLVELDLSGNSMSHLPDALGSFSTLLILKLNENRLSGGDMSPLSNLPALRELSVSKNVITYVLEEVAGPGRFPHLLFLDLTHNRISEEASIGSLSSLPSLRMLLLADNPLSARQHMKKLASREDPEPQKGPQIHFNHVPELPPKATIASILSTTRVKIKEPLDPKAAAKAAAAAAAVAATSDEVLIDAFDRLDTAIDTWQLNTVDEADEDDGAVEPDHTFLTGIGLVEQLEAPLPEPREPSGSKRPTWEDVEDPTERLALALGLNPNLLAVHTGKPTNDR
ncbi:hypothetical protein CEUSTIGMA_g12060.t1 [Chlamydomonas eustigma]|uniref:Uncharacterized protein n=1 Tax=Chlamydomonas eustigma TaxID=1157962 RepID=A0A250XNW6_9CHLO|nr:hypothetical protein CEUSTIGMA_g12060.t1 [Chlamydomonas eustigma]|eukprot:GAX84639.1 hypothetical protein CEUSTIGMA_g12060.t1 [Chlamydomonas eustigma]